MIERVVVTGASNGIGAACVEAFRDLGAEVVGVDKEAVSAADVHVELDLAAPDCGVALHDRLEGRPVDVLVNNAAIGFALEAIEADASVFDAVIAVNLRAPFLLSTALHPTLAERSGVVVNVASVHAVATSGRVSAYAASKGGLVALTRALALEWAPAVRVNCVLPGAVDTELLQDGLSRAGATLDEFAGKQPMRRVGEPKDIAEAVVYLASGGFTTGATLVVDGGASARLSTE
jgi:NAD(P)-dependent dehydrogenase (short-subunit alcohol dehydrogenase family)